MSTRVIVSMLFTLSVIACSEDPDEGQGSAGIGGNGGQLSGGTSGNSATGGVGASGSGGSGGGAGVGGAAGVMPSGGAGGDNASSGGAGGEGGMAVEGGMGGEAAADAGDAGVGGSSGAGPQTDLGPCCEAHEGPGCQDQATAECVCAMIPSCCTETWEEACALMVTQKRCEPGVRDCVCGDGPEQWQLQDQCCMGDWPALCQSTAVQKCGAKDSCF